jgi:hypothetical protein
MTRRGVDAVLKEPGNSALVRALDAALAEPQMRPAIDRALMQSDLWSAFDVLSSLAHARGVDAPSRLLASPLLDRLARLIAKIALTRAEIERLPDNYAAARRSGAVPDLFAPAGPWIEVEWGKERMHDGSESSAYRQAARVFVRPLPSLYGRLLLLALAEQRPATTAVALVRQMMLVDRDMRVVPAPVIVEAQVRTFDRDAAAAHVSTTFEEFELSRRVMRGRPTGGGFVRFDGRAPAYLAVAGNDYGFATPELVGMDVGAPVLGTLRTRCNGCHGPDGSHLMSFSLVGGDTLPPPIAFTQPNDIRVRYVAAKKEERPEFAHLVALMRAMRR